MNLVDETLRRAAESPDRGAIEELDGGRSLTFEGLEQGAGRLAEDLRSLGFVDGARIAIALGNSLEWVVAIHGCWLAGATPVLVNQSLTDEETGQLAVDVGATGIFVERPRQIKGISEARLDSSGGLSFHGQPRPLPNPPAQACIIFTSGTEGKPKPAVLRHEGLSAATASIAQALRGKPGPYPIASPMTPPSFICLPLSHTGGLASFLFAIHVGRSVLLARKFSPEALRVAIERFRIDSLVATPSMLHMMLEEPDLHLGTMRMVQSTGAPLALPLQLRFEERFGIPVIQNYGQTETAHVAGWTRDDLREGRWRPGSVGRAYAGVEIEIRSEDGGQQPPGELGEIVVRSDHTMAGYEGHGERLPGAWIATGDLGYFDEDEYLFVVDRKREVIICGGFNIYPAELEASLLEHPDVVEVAVVGVPDERLGEIPRALVVLRDDADMTGDDVVEFSRGRTAHYRALRQAEIVDELPMTATEKVHRAVIRKQATADLAAGNRSEGTQATAGKGKG